MHNFRFVGGKLFCEGVSIASLVKKYGTPLYIYSQHTLTDHFQKLDAAMATLAPGMIDPFKSSPKKRFTLSRTSIARTHKSQVLSKSSVFLRCAYETRI